ncbi:unnamed protein product [Caenorhabditis auriculariae]|uniref:Uncharacterized protein n=1 Tax=Caenorhabditis auriculariae TaxID=2777116 RepID=A0A8S1GY51_9PELO|nr:unnamed protein product [Caenorhabditis auriculariae]
MADMDTETLAKIGKEEYDLLRLLPDVDDDVTRLKFELILAEHNVLRCQIALKNVKKEEPGTPRKILFLEDELAQAEKELQVLRNPTNQS